MICGLISQIKYIFPTAHRTYTDIPIPNTTDKNVLKMAENLMYVFGEK